MSAAPTSTPTIASASPAAHTLAVSPTHLMHVALAHGAPELRTLDVLVRGRAHGAIPPELLLVVRGHLLHALVADAHTRSTAALDEFEAAGAERLCGECAEYNAQVYGAAPWAWPNFVHGCDCPRAGERASDATTPRPRVGEKPPRCRREWLEAHLATRLVPARPVWAEVEAMLGSVGCTVRRPASCEHESVQPRAVIEARADAPCPASALRLACIEFGLGGEEVQGVLRRSLSVAAVAHFRAAPADHQETVTPFTAPSKAQAAMRERLSLRDSASSAVFGAGALGLAVVAGAVFRADKRAVVCAAAIACALGTRFALSAVL
jgi:hypothetical protein